MRLIKTRLSDFTAAHRLIKNYQGKCRNLHGHNYQVALTLQADCLDENDFVVDFNDVKTLCNNWLQTYLDHGVLVCEHDHALLTFLKQENQKYYVLPNGVNSTVEALAEHVFAILTEKLRAHPDTLATNLQLYEIEIWENQRSSAIYRLDCCVSQGEMCGKSS